MVLLMIYKAYKKKFLQMKNFKISGFWVHPPQSIQKGRREKSSYNL